MKKIGKWHRLGALLCIIVLAFVALSPPAYAETASEKYQRLKEELNQINKKIEDTKSNKQNAVNLKAAYEQQKIHIDELIELNKQEITETEAALAAKEQEVADKREAIYQNDQLFQERLVSIYKMNNASTLSTLLNVDSYSDFLTVYDSLQRISQHDTDLLAQLSQQRADLENEQAQIDEMLATLNETHTRLAEEVEALTANIMATNSAISKADAAIKAQQQAYDETSAEAEAARQEMVRIASSIKGSTSSDGSEYVGGAFSWPVPGFYSISVYFGQGGHRGIDIRGNGIQGQPAVSVGNGTVIVAAYAHSSYGNYVVVDHGGGIRSLYAHLESISVSSGTQVSAGTQLGGVGNTGYSFGYHLHLEIHKDGVLQNPLSYLKG